MTSTLLGVDKQRGVLMLQKKRLFFVKKWRGSLKVIAVLGFLYLLFLAISSFFSNPSSETYIEVFVGDWLKYGNDSRLQPVFDVVPGTEQVEYVPTESTVSVAPGISVGRYVPYCGMAEACPKGEFSVHIYTGKDHNDQPLLCVDGKYILGKTVNGGGRGINVAVIDTLTNTVVQVKNFDTYEHESTQLETLLLTLRTGDILVMLTFDEPTKMLSRVAKLLFHELGSGLAQNLQYRASWYLLTQKGISGFAPFEGLHLIESDGWPLPHDERFCASLKMQGQSIHPDPLPRINPPRRDFCRRHQDFPIFCDGDAINDPLLASAALRSGLAGNDIFNVPVIVMSGENVTYLPVTLETIVRQPGINPKNVVVYYLPKHHHVAELSDLFGFMSEELTSADRCAQVVDAFETTSLLFPDAKALLFLEANVILSPDFLSYMGHVLPLFGLDPTLHFLSAWNDNGFTEVSGVPELLHRASRVASLALLIRKKAVSKDLCRKRSREDWLAGDSENAQEVIFPDLSRVLYIPPDGTASRARNTSMFSEVHLQSVHEMVKEAYDKRLSSDLQSARALSVDYTSLEQCVAASDGDESRGLLSLVPNIMSKNATEQVHVLAIYYEQTQAADYSVINRLCYCLGLFSHPNSAPRGSYQGTLRFTWSDHLVYLVGSLSPHYVHKPTNLVPIVSESEVLVEKNTRLS